MVKSGLRKTRFGSVQKWYCKSCSHFFSEHAQPYAQYPLSVVLFAVESYNRGYPIRTVKAMTGRKFRCSPPERTMYSWIRRYQDLLSFE